MSDETLGVKCIWHEIIYAAVAILCCYTSVSLLLSRIVIVIVIVTIFLSFFTAVLGFHCYVQTFSSCGESGLLSSCGAWVSHCSVFSCCRAQGLGYWGLSSCGQSDSDPFSHVCFSSLKPV